MANKVVFFSLLIISAVNLLRADGTKSLTTESLADSINQFGSDLLNGLYPRTPAEGNLLVSPINAYAALALLHLGAAGKTRQDLSATMKVPEPGSFKKNSEIHERLNAILSQMSSPRWDKPGDKFRETKLANGIFLQKDFPIKLAYKELARRYYNSSVKNLDFNGEAPGATNFINKWISNSTEGRISGLFKKPVLGDTIVVLISALYFKATWKNAFSSKNTKIEKFNTGSTEIKVPMMNMKDDMRHSQDDTLHYDSVSLPYSGEEYDMTIYLQHSKHGDHRFLAHLFHTLAEQNFAPNTTETNDRLVNLKLPKMKLSWKNSLANALKLGATFKSPDLDEMTPMKGVKVSNVVHATELEVDEAGSVASAATEIDIMGKSVRPIPVDFHVNRPFLVTVAHRPTRTILFAGIVRKPIM